MSFTLSAKSEPFLSDPPDAGSFYEALGRLIFLWGRFEIHMSTALISLVALLRKDGLQREIPLSWKLRAKTWREGFTSLPDLAQEKDYALKFVERAMSEVEKLATR